jgi:hypothetical protein
LIATLGLVDPVLCIAFSRNDKFVALGFAREVWIFVINNKETIKHKLPAITDSKPESQRICFSADGEKVIVATRYVGGNDSTGNVSTYVNECTSRDMGSNLPLVKIPTVSQYSKILLHISLQSSNFFD